MRTTNPPLTTYAQASRSVLECGPDPSGPLLPREADRCPSKSAAGQAQSKTWRLGRLFFCFLLSAFFFPALAQYSIDWSTIDVGGGASTSGVYTVTGTIGQPDAGAPMTNGQYSVTGGFWALPLAVQTPEAPTLTIAPGAPGFALISWTPNTPGFVLQETPSLAPTNWVSSPSGPANPVVVPATLPTKFYRLHKP